MSFRPSLHGWPFASITDMTPAAPDLGAALAGVATPGGGLCWAALDRYRRGARIPRDLPAPEPGEPLHAELVRRETQALAGVRSRIRDWQGRPEGSWRDRLPIRVSGGRDLASLSRAEWPSIRSRLDRGEPVLLTLLDHADPYRAGRAVRQVLATGWRLDDVRVLLSIYDPTRPDTDDLHLAFGPAGTFDARTTGGQRVRGFFAVPYDRSVPAPIRAETFADRSVIGLNRRVRGRVSPVTARKRLDLVARDAEGSLLHFRRARGHSWEGVNITDREELGSHELHSDPVAVRVGGRLHVFARSYVGDLLHFQDGRGWSVENRTEHRRAGPRFRIEGRPVAVAGPWRRLDVLGVDKDGGLVHYWGQPVLGWRAEQVAGDHLTGDPVAAWAGDTLHVAGLSLDGDVVHWTWDGSTWSPTGPGRGPDGAGTVRGKGRLAMRVAEDEDGEHTVHLALRGEDDRLLALDWRSRGGWAVHELADGVSSDPVLIGGPAGAHLFARSSSNGLIHAWRAGEWHAEDVLATRPTLAPVSPSDAVAAWGSDEELRVWARADRDLWTLTWRADADWVLDRLTDRAGVAERHRPGDDPIVHEDATGAPHLFFTDGKGTVLHVEPGPWRDPADDAKPAGPAAAETRRPATAAAPQDQSPAQPAPEPEPEARSEPQAEPPAPQPEPEPGPEPEVEEPAATAESFPAAPGTEKEPATDLPYMDFEADPPPAERPAEAEKPVQEEEEEAPAVEPMDLSLLDSWPPPPASLRKKRAERLRREAEENAPAEDGTRSEDPVPEREEA